MFHWPWLPLTVATALRRGCVAVAMAGQKGAELGRGWRPRSSRLVQFAVLGDQRGQPAGGAEPGVEPVATFFITKQPEAVQWSPLMFFLVVFVLGLAVVAWMISQVAKLPAEGNTQRVS